MKNKLMAAAVALALSLFSYSTLSAQTMAAVTVTTNSLGTQIPVDFLGLSMEWQYAQDYFGTTSAPNNTFFQLMENLGTGVYRIGGNSTDEWCWDSGPSQCQHQMTAGMINSIFNASAKTGFGVIAGVNLTDGSTTNAVDTVTAFLNDGLNAYPGSKLIGAEIGNEPDLFDTSTNTSDATYPSSYTIGDNESDYKKFITALNANATTKGVPWVGPAFAGGWSSQLGSWISAAKSNGVGTTLPNPALITIHNYPLSNCGSSAGTGTISGLLSASAMTSHIAQYGGYEQTAANAGYKLRVAETNSSACGGSPGVSDVQAAALWAMDDMFEYAQAGIVGVNFHGGGTSTSNGEDYSAVFTTGSNGQGTASQGATVAPLYYGMLMFSNATGKYLLPTTVSTSDNIKAYAVAASALADPQVFVINKDTSASGLVSVKPSETMYSATLLIQSGSSLSDSNPSYGGVRPNASTGILPAPSTTTLTPNASGVFQFTLANASAAMITMHRGTPTATPTPVVASIWRVNAGGPSYTDSQGNLWAADENFTGGAAAVTTNTIASAKPGTADGTLYQSQRYGTSFSYIFNVPAGSYQVTLKFAETYFTTAGSRVFSYAINGVTQQSNFDIYSLVGQNTALDEVYNNISGASGAITISFGPASVNNAVVQAIQIVPQPATATPTFTFSKSPTVTLTSTYTSTVTMSPTATTTFTSSPTSTNTPAFTPTSTPTNTLSPTATQTNSSTATTTPTNTLSATATRTNSNTATSTNTLTYTFTPTGTPTFTTSSTPTNTSTGTTVVNSPTGTSTLTHSPTATNTLSSTSTPTATSTNTYTAITMATNTDTGTPTYTSTSTSTLAANTSTFTLTPSVTVTNTPTSSRTATSTATNSQTSTPTATSTSTLTYTFTKTLTPTSTPTNTGTWTSTQAPPTHTNTPTATSTWTNTAIPPTTTPTGTATRTATTSSGCSGIPNWSGNFVSYSVGQKVAYNGEVYECLQSHKSQSDWTPSAVPALWKDLGPCGSVSQAVIAAQPVVYPNPVTSSTLSIQLPVSNASNVSVQVFTVAMRQVHSVNIPQVIGNTMTMQAMDKSGVNLANGLYYFMIQANGQKWINKVLVLR